MMSPAAMVLAGILFATSSGGRLTTPFDPALTDIEAFSAVAGGVLGAAAVCKDEKGEPGLSDERLYAAAGKVAMVVASSNDARERAAAHELFKTNVRAGIIAVRTGRTDCATVKASLTKLEQLGTI